MHDAAPTSILTRNLPTAIVKVPIIFPVRSKETYHLARWRRTGYRLWHHTAAFRTNLVRRTGYVIFTSTAFSCILFAFFKVMEAPAFLSYIVFGIALAGISVSILLFIYTLLYIIYEKYEMRSMRILGGAHDIHAEKKISRRGYYGNDRPWVTIPLPLRRKCLLLAAGIPVEHALDCTIINTDLEIMGALRRET